MPLETEIYSFDKHVQAHNASEINSNRTNLATAYRYAEKFIQNALEAIERAKALQASIVEEGNKPLPKYEIVKELYDKSCKLGAVI